MSVVIHVDGSKDIKMKFFMEYEKILEACELLNTQFTELKSQQTEALAKIFDNHDPDIAEKIRTEGPPAKIYCGEEIYTYIEPALGNISRIIISPIIDNYSMVLVWSISSSEKITLELNIKTSWKYKT